MSCDDSFKLSISQCLHKINDYLFHYYDPIYCTARSTTNGKPVFHLQKGSHNFRDSHRDICHSCLPYTLPSNCLLTRMMPAFVAPRLFLTLNFVVCKFTFPFLMSSRPLFRFVIYIVYLLIEVFCMQHLIVFILMLIVT